MQVQKRSAAAADSCWTAGSDSISEAGWKKECNDSGGVQKSIFSINFSNQMRA